MSRQLLQREVATSRLTLPVTVTYTALIWAVMLSLGMVSWGEAACVWLAALLFTALNNREALLPFYSQSLSCTFLMLATTLSATCGTFPAAVCVVGLSSFLFILLSSYQDRNAPGTVYFAFIMLGIVSLYFIKALFYLPFLWFVMRSKLMNLGSRAFFASLLGILTPYWFLLGYWSLTGELAELPSRFRGIAAFDTFFDYSTLSPWQWITLAMTVGLGVAAVIYFLSTSYTDKIRTRLINEALAILFFVTIALLALQPSSYAELMSIMVVIISPLAGRMLALSHTKLSNLLFILSVITCVVYTACLLWTRS